MKTVLYLLLLYHPQMCANTELMSPQSSLAHMRSYAENSSIHGEILCILFDCDFCRCSISVQQISCLSDNLVHLGDLCSCWRCLLFWEHVHWLAGCALVVIIIIIIIFIIIIIITVSGRTIELQQTWRPSQSQWPSLTFLLWPSARMDSTSKLLEKFWKWQMEWGQDQFRIQDQEQD